MNLKDQQKRLHNLHKMKTIVSANRSISLIEIYKISKKIRQNYNNFQNSKYFIQEIEKQLQLVSDLILANKNTNRKLWIYITEEQKYTKDFYLKTEEIIFQKAQKNDFFIAIGESAFNYLNNHNYQIIQKFDNQSKENLAIEISYIVQLLIESNQIEIVNILLHTNKVNNSVLTIFPIDQVNFKYLSNNEINYPLEEKKFYPDIDNFLKSQEKIYLESILKIALLESSFIIYKNKIIQENKTLKEIDQTILELKLNVNKIKQEVELEELVLLTSNENSAIFNYKESKTNEKK